MGAIARPGQERCRGHRGRPPARRRGVAGSGRALFARTSGAGAAKACARGYPRSGPGALFAGTGGFGRAKRCVPDRRPAFDAPRSRWCGGAVAAGAATPGRRQAVRRACRLLEAGVRRRRISAALTAADRLRATGRLLAPRAAGETGPMSHKLPAPKRPARNGQPAPTTMCNSMNPPRRASPVRPFQGMVGEPPFS